MSGSILSGGEGDSAALRAPLVYLSRDHTMDPFLDEFAEALEASGVEVCRGPVSRPGIVTELDERGWHDLGRADFALFSSRSRCTRAMLQAATRLRAIVTPTIGVETVDLEAASEFGILVANGAAPENYESMAEATVMLMLNLSYGLRESECILREGRSRPTPDQLQARMLKGRTVGILGFGQIGRRVAQLLEPFGVRLIAFSPHADRATVPPSVTLTDFRTVMSESDIVGVFIAVTAENRELVNEAALALMKPDACLVNVARGSAVDEAALIRTLQRREIRGAALDTFAVEPLPMDSPLRDLDNVILTPHLVGHTREGFQALRTTLDENLRRMIVGKMPVYCKNPGIERAWRVRIDGLSDSYRVPAGLA